MRKGSTGTKAAVKEILFQSSSRVQVSKQWLSIKYIVFLALKGDDQVLLPIRLGSASILEWLIFFELLIIYLSIFKRLRLIKVAGILTCFLQDSTQIRLGCLVEISLDLACDCFGNSYYFANYLGYDWVFG